MEERKIKVLKKDVGYGEEHYLGGYASYKRVVDRFIGNNLVLCNNIINVDNELFYNRECGFADYDDLKEERLEELNQLINKYAKESNDRLKGQIVPVLIESESDKKGKMMGYTDTMKLVNVNIGKEYIGKIINVKITETKTWSIEGELCE